MILSKYQIFKIPEIFHCQICDYLADNRHISCILSHLQAKHQISRGNRSDGINGEFIDYINKYFGNPKCACGCGRVVNLQKRKLQFNLFSEDCKRKHRFMNPCCPEFYLFKGYSVDETVSSIIEQQSGRIISDTEKDNLKIINSGHNNPNSIKSIIRRTGKSEVRIRAELSNKSKGKNNGFYGHRHSSETLQKLAIARSKQAKTMTKPEMIMYGAMAASNIEFEYQAPIGPYVVDFLLNNIVVEVYGDYWHSNKINGGIKKSKDKIKEQYLIDAGYALVIIWESELTPNMVPSLVARIANEIKINK